MMISVVIPAYNEESCIAQTVVDLHEELERSAIDHEILVVDDASTDRTSEIVRELAGRIPSVRSVTNTPPHGFGMAVRRGLSNYRGDAVAIYMADASDRPSDLVRFVRTMERDEVDCVFGTRWSGEATVHDYPLAKLLVNRSANVLIQLLFGTRYNDVTNAFKLYRRHVVDAIGPIRSRQFNLTVELPLKSIARGYSFAVVPNDWINRKSGVSKLKLRQMGSRYAYILGLCLAERWLPALRQRRIAGRTAS
jgi:dolichol-phosphate mannosyltransferase